MIWGYPYFWKHPHPEQLTFSSSSIESQALNRKNLSWFSSWWFLRVFGITLANGWWNFKDFGYFWRYYLGNDPIWRTYFFRWVVQPPTSCFFSSILGFRGMVSLFQGRTISFRRVDWYPVIITLPETNSKRTPGYDLTEGCDITPHWMIILIRMKLPYFSLPWANG